jgi:uncharacterized protein
MNLQHISLISVSGLPINCSFRPAKRGKNSALVIFAHGFKGFMNWGGFPYFISRLSESGFSAVSFDFSMNGVSSDTPEEFTRLDLFAKNTISNELDDLNTVIDHFYDNEVKYKINKNKICLIGHSRGGAAAILKASEDRRINGLITLAAVASLNRYTQVQKEKWKENGYIEIPNSRTNQVMRMNISFLEDIEKNSERFDIKNAISRLKIPVLLIHGKEDLAVKYKDALELYDNSDRSRTELILLENTGHTFGIEHPFKGTTQAFEEIVAKVSEYLKQISF